MGLFLFLIIALAAAWGMVWELNDPPPPPDPVVIVQHKAPPPAVSEAAESDTASPPLTAATAEGVGEPAQLVPPSETAAPETSAPAPEQDRVSPLR